MRFADASLAAAYFVQLFIPTLGWPQPDQLVRYTIFGASAARCLLLGSLNESF
jgi:hypothetical protein